MDDKEVKEKLYQVLKISRPPTSIDYKRSAVLLPLIQEQGDLSVLFEVRSFDLSWQPGDICFPGGRIESQDKTPMAAAVRETSEELGINTSDITVLGPLGEIASKIGIMLYPFIGYIAKTAEIKPNTQEVAEVFTVPLRFLLKASPLKANMEMATKPRKAFPFDFLLPDYPRDWMVRADYQVYFYQYQEHVIWGLTAKVLKDFLDRYREQLLALL